MRFYFIVILSILPITLVSNAQPVFNVYNKNQIDTVLYSKVAGYTIFDIDLVIKNSFIDSILTNKTNNKDSQKILLLFYVDKKVSSTSNGAGTGNFVSFNVFHYKNYNTKNKKLQVIPNEPELYTGFLSNKYVELSKNTAYRIIYVLDSEKDIELFTHIIYIE